MTRRMTLIICEFQKIGYIERIQDIFKENNHFRGYFGEYLGWRAEIFRIGVAYDPSTIFHYRIENSARRPIYHINPVRPFFEYSIGKFE